jgi:hypothetical protein
MCHRKSSAAAQFAASAAADARAAKTAAAAAKANLKDEDEEEEDIEMETAAIEDTDGRMGCLGSFRLGRKWSSRVRKTTTDAPGDGAKLELSHV